MPTRPRSRLAAFLLEPGAVSLVASLLCGGVTACGSGLPATDPKALDTCGEEPSFDAPALPYTAPRSRLGSRIHASQSALARELGRKVPRMLAEERGRSIGAPGKLSYTLRRGDFSFHPTTEAFSVRTRLTADVEVCKPFGAFCARYGTCRPEWHADVTLPFPLSVAAPPELLTRVTLTNGCVLSPIGYNATPELERITQREARRFQDQVRSRSRQMHRQWLDKWRTAAQPVRFAEGASDCMRFSIETLRHEPIEQTPAEPNGEELTLAFEASGQIVLSCEPVDERALPKVSLEPQLDPGVELAVAHPLAFKELERALNEQLSQQPNTAGRSIEFRAGSNSGKSALFAALNGFGECSVEWTPVIPRLKNDALVFEPAPGKPSSPGRRWLTEHGRVPLPAEWLRLRSLLPDLTQRWLGNASKNEGTERTLLIDLSSDVEPSERFQIYADSVSLILSLHGTLEASIGGRSRED